ncbi:Unsaturated glucuronyl hydrolase [subsurface metagenome]
MKSSCFLLHLTLLTAVFSFASCSPQSSDQDIRIDHALDYALSQLEKSAATLTDTDRFPTNDLPDGTWNTSDRYGWTSGFFPGCLWYAFDYTGDDEFRKAAVKWTESLEPVKDYTGGHDVGFMMNNSYGHGCRMTGNEEYRAILVRSAQSLSMRYKRVTGVIKSWDFNRDIWQYPVIVDNMMNLELLFWAWNNGGYSELFLIAEEHAIKTAYNHVRPDGSTFHVVDYNPDTGEVNGKYTHQGYSKDSAWSRGQAWALYGFTMTYRETNNAFFLETAVKAADYFIDNLPDDHIPYWDFNAPDIPDEPRDSSAAAIAASGLLELSGLVSDTPSKNRYYTAAVAIIESLCTPEYLTEGTRSPGILRHGVGSLPAGSQVDVSLIYGDYYFIEALLRYKRGIGSSAP